MAETGEPEIEERVRRACDIAAGRAAADPAAPGKTICGAKKDLNCKGEGPEWYLMVWRGAWRYVSDGHLPRGTYLAADRRAATYGKVYPGEIVACHDRGGPLKTPRLICEPNEDGKVMVKCDFVKRRDGSLAFTLPDGSEVVLPDPRSK